MLSKDISIIINEIKQIDYSCFYFDNSNFCLINLDVNPQLLQQKNDFEKSRKYVHNFIFIPNNKVKLGIVNEINTKISSDRK